VKVVLEPLADSRRPGATVKQPVTWETPRPEVEAAASNAQRSAALETLHRYVGTDALGMMDTAKLPAAANV
jgi:hypothetical protein